MGTADHLATCNSCHIGGGPTEGIVQADGTVTPYDDPGLSPTHSYDRDFYSYDADATVRAFYDAETIADSVAAAGEPKPHDWSKSGVMEADCLMCHIDPESPQTLMAADGLKVNPNRPRMMVFAERNQDGEVVKISLGTPLHTGLANESAMPYTNDLQRMSRPTPMMALMQLPAENVGEMMDMWTKGLQQIEENNIANNETRLPYALYGQNVTKIWDMNGIKAEYCANPAGPADEMARLMANGEDINNLFSGFLQYMIGKGFLPPEATMEVMMGMFFNDFIYAYKIKNSMDPNEGMMPIPFGLRAYDQGKFYTDWDNPNASTRDYVRAPLVEGQGVPYTGRVGLAWQATMYGMGLAMQGDPTYIDASTGQVMADQVVADYQSGIISKENIKMVLRDYLPNFFNVMPTAELMGLDLDQDGTPLSYIQLLKDEESGEWTAKTYWEVDEITHNSVHQHIFGGGNDADDPRWVKVCGQCHVMTHDGGNSEVDVTRLYNLGIKADFVKNGQFVHITDDKNAAGYDVHMSEGALSCGSCHFAQAGHHLTKDLEKVHNFLKGTDTAHMVRNDLDNNYRPKTCESCHLAGKAPGAADPTAAHEAKFGEYASRHIENIACQTCHVPFKKTWRFRAFDDTLGYYGNFDNRMGYNVLPGGDYKLMAFPGEYALSPVYGTSPGYGIPHFNMLAQHIDADGRGTASMDYVSEMVDYFHLTKEGNPGQIVNGMPTNPRFDFWKYFYQMGLNMKQGAGIPLSFDPQWDNEVYPPLYWANGQNGYPQIVIGNPITIMTWVDANPDNGEHDMSSLPYGGAKILYLREIMAAIKDYQAPTMLGANPADLAAIPPNDATWAQSSMVGKVILKDSGYVIFDHTGDMYPDIWHVEDVRAMQDALKTVLMAEGVVDPQPVLFMAAHYFSDSHGVQPKEHSLGSSSCTDCHGEYNEVTGNFETEPNMPGAYRTTDRLINFLPWSPPWFSEANRALKFNHENGQMEPTGNSGTDGKGALFIVDGEVDYIEPVSGNGLRFLGAKAEDVLHLSKHHAEHLFYLHGEEKVSGNELPGINQRFLTSEEKEQTYIKQIANGPRDRLVTMFIPEHLKPELTEMGMPQFVQDITFADEDGKTTAAKGYVVRVGLHHESTEAMFISMPVIKGAPNRTWPILLKQDDIGEPWHQVNSCSNSEARIIGAFADYVKVKLWGGSGRYTVVWANGKRCREPRRVSMND